MTIDHDVVILGAGLAGLRAAVEIARKSRDSINIGIVAKVQLMRAHSVCAEGGTAAVLREEEGDNLDLHAWDTVKGSDFLADQDVVYKFVETCPQEILLLDHWGLPWSRHPDGRIVQRPFGGHSYPRATMPPTRPASSRCRRCTTPSPSTTTGPATMRPSPPPSSPKTDASKR